MSGYFRAMPMYAVKRELIFLFFEIIQGRQKSRSAAQNTTGIIDIKRFLTQGSEI